MQTIGSSLSQRENKIRAIRFDYPEYIPMTLYLNRSCWHHYDQNALQDLMESHPFLFPNFKRQKVVRPEYLLNQLKDTPYTDPWKCVWETMDDGITGSVHQHPLANWSAFEQYGAPDANKTDGTYPIDWNIIRENVKKGKARGEFITGGLPHGHTFLRLQDIRGYENLIFDMIDEEPRLFKLIEIVEEFNCQYVQNWLELKPDMMKFPEDLGMQVGPMISPELFRKYFTPVYRRMIKPARDQGCIVHMHSDGDIRTLVNELIDGGVEVFNLQDLVNGIDWIRDNFAGHTCIDLDIDRQSVITRGTPAQVDNLIREEVEKLGSKAGGLMMIHDLYPGIPLENIKALMDAMEKYAFYYS